MELPDRVATEWFERGGVRTIAAWVVQPSGANHNEARGRDGAAALETH